MKKIITIFLLLMAIPLSAHIIFFGEDANQPASPPAPAPIVMSSLSFDAPKYGLIDENTTVLWDFTNPTASGNEQGLSGYGFDTQVNLLATQFGTVTGSVNTTSGSGGDGYYRVFDGSTDYFTTSQVFITGSAFGDFTVDAMVKLGLLDVNQDSLFEQTETIGVAGIFLGINNGNFRFFVSNGTSLIVNINTTATTLSITKWYHVAITRSGNIYKLTISDIAVGGLITSTAVSGTGNTEMVTTTTTGAWTVSQSPFIGRRSDIAGNYFNGSYDWLRISKIARYQ